MYSRNGLRLPSQKTNDPYSTSRVQRVAPAIAVIGLAIAAATSVVNWVSISDVGNGTTVAETSLWANGVGVAGLAVIKIAIAAALVGIIARLWIRFASVGESIPFLSARDGASTIPRSLLALRETTGIPPANPIHKMATRMWQPMLAMGVIAVVAGTIGRIDGATRTAGTETFRQAAAWSVGLEFLGEALLLGGIAFLLGTILASLRQAGSEVQHDAGSVVRLPKMPNTAKLFVMLMMVGVMIGVGQFVASLALVGLADDPSRYAHVLAVLGPVREIALASILLGIVFALVTIGNVLRFQFTRVRELVRHNSLVAA